MNKIPYSTIYHSFTILQRGKVVLITISKTKESLRGESPSQPSFGHNSGLSKRYVAGHTSLRRVEQSKKGNLAMSCFKALVNLEISLEICHSFNRVPPRCALPALLQVGQDRKQGLPSASSSGNNSWESKELSPSSARKEWLPKCY